jgi:hypothetical protein
MTPAAETPIPDPAQRAELNRQLHTTGTDSGFWDNHGRPALWPDDINEWTPSSSEPEQQPF